MPIRSALYITLRTLDHVLYSHASLLLHVLRQEYSNKGPGAACRRLRRRVPLDPVILTFAGCFGAYRDPTAA